MSKKSLTVLGICLVSVLGLSMQSASAKSKNAQDIPDVDGTYDVPGHPKLKVRVFVHYPKKQAKPPQTTCNLTDPDSDSFVDPAGWHLPSNWEYYLNTASAPSGAVRNNLPNYTSQAFSAWTSATGNKVTFSSQGTTSITRKAYDGRNIIAWGSAPGTALGVTYTWYYPSTGQAVETDTIMNKRFPWSWTAFPGTTCPNPNAYDAQDILTHELGHWVGLDDEYTEDYVNNTMYGYGKKGEIIKDTLTDGDSAGAFDIYNK